MSVIGDDAAGKDRCDFLENIAKFSLRDFQVGDRRLCVIARGVCEILIKATIVDFPDKPIYLPEEFFAVAESVVRGGFGELACDSFTHRIESLEIGCPRQSIVQRFYLSLFLVQIVVVDKRPYRIRQGGFVLLAVFKPNTLAIPFSSGRDNLDE